MRILLAEDDRALGQALADGLRQLGYAVDWITDGNQAAAALADTTYAAAVLDWNLPRSSGPAIIAGMRRRQDATPVLLLTARDELADRVAGLDAGADDYVVKPVHLDELAARLRALLRRADGQVEPAIRLGALEVTPAARSVTLAGAALELTAREYALLEMLVRHPGRAYSREQLEEALYGWDREVASNAVEVHIHYLRHKLGPGWIRTLRGIGYAINPPGGPAT
ncbi:response regulator transcription factor [Rhodanobacter sp. B2A1Ga4]|uniref:response regulator transcription factor n=1 Tax=Rhodanobacter sp. B2A1Ga4 TaxID=2778647 RepID=UPI001B37C6FC|nr:response regulator transcription factor [Rhodanobacter sp. B2A1Ga4]MBQ4856250.1 response regulator transcription factor [Rhodanobacter sp. B2A1Ga4]